AVAVARRQPGPDLLGQVVRHGELRFRLDADHVVAVRAELPVVLCQDGGTRPDGGESQAGGAAEGRGHCGQDSIAHTDAGSGRTRRSIPDRRSVKLLLLAIVLLLALAAAGPAFCRATPPPGPAGVRAAIAVEPRHALAGFGAPIRAFALPPILQEVSAVTGVDEHTVACLQDEKGIVFLIDVRDGSVRASLPFGPDGDYEGLARVGQDYFVLRSDGLLARVTPRSSGLAIAESFALQTPNHDLEGLCHDAANHVLLLAPKDVVKPDAADAPDAAPEDRRRAAAERKAARDRRTLFAFDLQTSRL